MNFVLEALRDDLDETVLGEIIANKKVELVERSTRRPLATFVDAVQPSERSLADALMAPGLSLIAEIKTQAPSSGTLRDSIDVDTVASIYGRYASAISVLADRKYFGGSLERLTQVRSQVPCPVLLKDFVISAYQLYEGREAGADAALLMASVLTPESIERLLQVAARLGMDCLVETHTEQEIDEVLATGAILIGVNNRDLRTLKVDIHHFRRLRPRITRGLTVAESGFATKEDLESIRGLADGVLIGSTLMRSPNIEATLGALGFEPKEGDPTS
jgi:indole-3-glycerol phosphate synthase / phosphoribosylanthranilate isomerase